MATIDHPEFLPTPGVIWSRIVDLWVGYVINEDWGWNYSNEGNTDDLRMYEIQIDDGTDTHIYKLHDCSSEFDDNLPINFIMNDPAWRTMPPVMAQTYGARDVADDFDTNVASCRRDLGQPNNANYTQLDKSSTSSSSIPATTHFWIGHVDQNLNVLSDCVVLCTSNDDTPEQFPDGNLPSSGSVPGQFGMRVTGASGGGDMSAVVTKLAEVVAQMELAVETLQEIALSRLDVSLNHGQVIASVSTTTTSEGE